MFMKSLKDKILLKMNLNASSNMGTERILKSMGFQWPQTRVPTKLLKKVADLMKVQSDDKQISTSHTLKTNSNYHVNTSKQKMYSSIIVRFSNRDKRNDFLEKENWLSHPSKETVTIYLDLKKFFFVDISPRLENFYTLKLSESKTRIKIRFSSDFSRTNSYSKKTNIAAQLK